MKDDIRELTRADFARAISRRQRERIIRGKISGREYHGPVAVHRAYQQAFADALGISVHAAELKQGRRVRRSCPGIAAHAARHPRVLRENLAGVSGSYARLLIGRGSITLPVVGADTPTPPLALWRALPASVLHLCQHFARPRMD